MLIGVGFTVGNWLGGRLADWSLDGDEDLPSRACCDVRPAAGFRKPCWRRHHPSGLGRCRLRHRAPVQMRVMQAASEAPGLASAINIGASTSATRLARRWGGRHQPGPRLCGGVDRGRLFAAAGLGLVMIGGREAAPRLEACGA